MVRSKFTKTKINQKGQISIESLAILGIILIGATIFAVFYLQSTKSQIADVPGTDIYDQFENMLTDDGSSCNYDNQCGQGENCSNCLNDCPCGPNESCVNGDCVGTTGCNNDGDCEPGETYANCPNDCHCGDEFCDPVIGENCGNCLDDCHCIYGEICVDGVCQEQSTCGNELCDQGDCGHCEDECPLGFCDQPVEYSNCATTNAMGGTVTMCIEVAAPGADIGSTTQCTEAMNGNVCMTISQASAVPSYSEGYPETYPKQKCVYVPSMDGNVCFNIG